MEKTVFKNQSFYTILIVVVGILLSLNIYNLVNGFTFMVALQISVSLLLFLLLLLRDKYAKTGITIWSVLLIVGSSLSILGKTIKVLLGDEVIPQIVPLIVNIVVLTGGLIIWHYNKTTVGVERIHKSFKE